MSFHSVLVYERNTSTPSQSTCHSRRLTLASMLAVGVLIVDRPRVRRRRSVSARPRLTPAMSRCCIIEMRN